MFLRLRIYWANLLTNIATKHPVLELAFHFCRKNFLFQFNSKILNAFVAIYFVWFINSIGGAGINTLGAGAAIIFNR